MSDKSQPNYTSIPDPYNSLMVRNEGVFGIAQVGNSNALDTSGLTTSSALDSTSITGTPATTDKTDSGDGTIGDGQFDNITITNWIRSRNYAPKKLGFMIDGGTGYAEFSNVYVSGTITSSTINGSTISGNTIVGGTISGTVVTGTTIFGGTISGTNITGGTITGGTITGSTIQTAVSGQRIRLVSSAASSPTQQANTIGLIDSSGNLVFVAGANSFANSVVTITESDNSPQPLYITSLAGRNTPVALVSIYDSSLQNDTALGVEVAGSSDGISIIADSGTINTCLYLDHMGSGNMIFTASGAKLTNAGTFTNASSRSLKEDFVEAEEGLIEAIKALKVYNYRYKKEAKKNIRHLTPVAEDFYGLLNLGDDKSISAADLAGLALVGVQYLLKRIT